MYSLPGSFPTIVAVKSFPKSNEFDMHQIYMEALVMNQIQHENIAAIVTETAIMC